jgi:signal transduction histidine kinase/PAS domain-containing protein
MLNSLASIPTPSVDDIFSETLTVLETNPRDIPFAMLYKLEEGLSSTTLQLQGHYGLPEGHKLLVASASIQSDEGLIPDMRRTGSEPIYIVPDERFEAVTWKGWGEPSTQVAILPIINGLRIFGYLVVGTNPYRPFNDRSRQFFRDLHRLVSGLVSSAVDLESSKRREEQLEADLAFSDLKLRHLISHASVGMCHTSLDGKMLWANDHYYHLAGKNMEEHGVDYAFLDVYIDEDRPKVQEVWEHLLAGVEHISAEFRTKRTWTSPNGEEGPASIQVLAFPYRDPESGQVKSIMACTTDISRLRWAQDFHARSAAEAREAKRQQEAFIDVVSHEMRNPLSAIVHCADAVMVAAEECQTGTADADFPLRCIEALSENLQSAKIIMQCAHHQKRIIDDVLTLSKLDAMLLSITPVIVKPQNLVDSIVSIFEAELKTHSIDCSITADSTFVDLAVEQVHLDSSRVTQVFINLMTNAIKFVKSLDHRQISIRFGACKANPRGLFPQDMFWATSEQNSDVTNSPDWGSGEEIFLTFAVQDSGIGLQQEDIAKIFGRFQQANVKTHVKYGGSGLGLFISKKLAEKQGGEIGVSSVQGKGSTFGFYVKTRRSEQTAPAAAIKFIKRTEDLDVASRQLNVLLVEDNIINQQVRCCPRHYLPTLC